MVKPKGKKGKGSSTLNSSSKYTNKEVVPDSEDVDPPTTLATPADNAEAKVDGPSADVAPAPEPQPDLEKVSSEIIQQQELILKPCRHLWHPDGNIVLRASNALYCVHKSILARHSAIFRDVFSSAYFGMGGLGPTGQGFCAQELYEGIPVLDMSDDDDRGILLLLEMIYELK